MGRFIAGEYAGKRQMFIQTDNYDSRLDNIHNQHQYFKFHSDYSYFVYRGQVTVNVTLPSHSRRTITYSNKKSSNTVGVPTEHKTSITRSLGMTLSSGDLFIAYKQGTTEPLTCSIPIQRNGDAFRVIQIYPSGSSVVVESRAITHEHSLPAMTLSFTLFVYAVAHTEGSHPGHLFYADASRVTFGQGKFDSNVRYMTRALTNIDSAILTKDRVLTAGTYNISTHQFDRSRLAMAYRFAGVAEKIGAISYLPNPIVHRIQPI